MECLECRVGGLKINWDKLGYLGREPYYACHKFVVEEREKLVLIYVTEAEMHSQVSSWFGLDEKDVIGGGSFYLNGKNQLALSETSTFYRAIPREVAQKFAKLIALEFEECGVFVKGVVINTYGPVNEFWAKRGFISHEPIINRNV